MASEISASFTLTGIELDPAEISAKVGITPTASWMKGDLIDPRGVIRYQENGWSIQSTLDKYASLEDHVKSVLEQLQPSWSSLVEVSAQNYAEIDCVIYTRGQAPEMHLDKDILRQISQLNAELDLDLYVLPEETYPATGSSALVENEMDNSPSTSQEINVQNQTINPISEESLESIKISRKLLEKPQR
jgi:hypothetical protein